MNANLMPEDAPPQQTNPWWKTPTTITLLVAIIAAVPPLTTGVQAFFNTRNQLALEKSKQLHELRQRYLDRILSDVENQRVLEFLVAVEEDEKLKTWAAKQLKTTEDRIRSKDDLYKETIAVVAKLANQTATIDPQSKDYLRFWWFYNEGLLPVETQPVEAVMVQIGRELKLLAATQKPPSPELLNLSFQLASTMKKELSSNQAPLAAVPK